MPAPAAKYRFGPYEVRVRTRELYKHGAKVKLRPQPFQVLQLLVERAPDVVSREALRQRLWSSGTFVDFEHGLNAAVKELRGVLCDSASDPRYIETLPKLGYHIIVPVEAELAASAGSHSGGSDDLATVETRPVSRAQDRWPWFVGATATILAITLAVWLWRHPRNLPPATDSRLMLAVLPFENLTGDPAQDYFSDGLTEEMISQLGRLDPVRMGVIARTSVMHYKHSQAPLEQIGRELGVQYVLEGSVRRDAGRIRISVQLIQLRDQTHLLSRQYDRELNNLLAVQSEIALEAADEIQLTLAPNSMKAAVATPPPLSPAALQAYDAYLEGRYFWNKRTATGLEQAAALFQKSIAEDPDFARAYAGLADTYAMMSSYSYRSPQIMPQARAAALQAVRLDEKLAEAHTSLALIAENYDYDLETAEKEYRLAIALNPNYATAHHWYAECLMWMGRFDEALRESDLARHLDPLSLIIKTDRGAIFYFARQYDRAIGQWKAVLQMDPTVPRAQMVNAAYVQQGRYAEALANVNGDMKRRWGPGVWYLAWRIYIYARSGQRALAQAEFDKLDRLYRAHRARDSEMIGPYIVMGKKDDAFRCLESAYSGHSQVLLGLKVDPLYDPLRSDRRFQDLLRRMGLNK